MDKSSIYASKISTARHNANMGSQLGTPKLQPLINNTTLIPGLSKNDNTKDLDSVDDLKSEESGRRLAYITNFRDKKSETTYMALAHQSSPKMAHDSGSSQSRGISSIFSKTKKLLGIKPQPNELRNPNPSTGESSLPKEGLLA